MYMSNFDRAVNVVVNNLLEGKATMNDIEKLYAYASPDVWLRTKEAIEIRLEMAKLLEDRQAS